MSPSQTRILLYALIGGAMLLGVHLLTKPKEPTNFTLPEPSSPVAGGGSASLTEPRATKAGEVTVKERHLSEVDEEGHIVPGLNMENETGKSQPRLAGVSF